MSYYSLGVTVEILGGMAEFVGQTGVIVANHEFDGGVRMYRVRLDKPVLVNGSEVTSDLWAGYLLKRVRVMSDEERAFAGMAGKRVRMFTRGGGR